MAHTKRNRTAKIAEKIRTEQTSVDNPTLLAQDVSETRHNTDTLQLGGTDQLDREEAHHARAVLVHRLRSSKRRRASAFMAAAATRGTSSYPSFAAVLSAAMIKAGITPSEAARRVWGTAKDKRGYVVARNRDRIGHYLTGTSYPNDENLHKLADVLGVPVDTLAVETRARSSGRPQRQTPHVGDATPPGPGGPQASSGLLRTTMPTAPEPLRLARFEVDRMISPELAITAHTDDPERGSAPRERRRGGSRREQTRNIRSRQDRRRHRFTGKGRTPA